MGRRNFRVNRVWISSTQTFRVAGVWILSTQAFGASVGRKIQILKIIAAAADAVPACVSHAAAALASLQRARRTPGLW